MDERERANSKKAARAAGNYKKLAARTKLKRRKIEVMSLEEELGEFYLSGGG